MRWVQMAFDDVQRMVDEALMWYNGNGMNMEGFTVSVATPRPFLFSECGMPSRIALRLLEGRLTPLMRAEYQQIVFPARPKSSLQQSRSRALLANHYPELLPGGR